jgi:hypothetical protein
MTANAANPLAVVQSITAELSAIVDRDADKYRLIKDQIDAAAGFTGDFALSEEELAAVRESFRTARAAMLKKARAFVRMIEAEIKADVRG